MNPIAHIRRKVLRLTQAEFAAVAGVAQATVSRWEKGELSPSLDEAARIRGEVSRRGKRWSDRWFFEVPPAPRSGGEAA